MTYSEVLAKLVNWQRADKGVCSYSESIQGDVRVYTFADAYWFARELETAGFKVMPEVWKSTAGRMIYQFPRT